MWSNSSLFQTRLTSIVIIKTLYINISFQAKFEIEVQTPEGGTAPKINVYIDGKLEKEGLSPDGNGIVKYPDDIALGKIIEVNGYCDGCFMSAKITVVLQKGSKPVRETLTLEKAGNSFSVISL